MLVGLFLIWSAFDFAIPEFLHNAAGIMILTGPVLVLGGFVYQVSTMHTKRENPILPLLIITSGFVLILAAAYFTTGWHGLFLSSGLFAFIGGMGILFYNWIENEA